MRFPWCKNTSKKDVVSFLDDEPSDLENSSLPKGKWSRREILVFAGMLGVGVGSGFYRVGMYSRIDMGKRLLCLTPITGQIFLSVLDAMLPDHASRDPQDLQRYVCSIDDYLRGINVVDIRQLRLMLYGLEQSPLLFGCYLQRFSRLNREARRSVLLSWQTHSIGLVRLGYQSLQTLVFLTYYQTKTSFFAIGYDGPIVPGYAGPFASRKRYASLLAPLDQEPVFSVIQTLKNP